MKCLYTLREEILGGRKFGRFGGFWQINFPLNLKIIVIRQIKFPPNKNNRHPPN